VRQGRGGGGVKGHVLFEQEGRPGSRGRRDEHGSSQQRQRAKGASGVAVVCHWGGCCGVMFLLT
jgi:hypothetical protein